jgi:hypothetical protein
MAWRVAKSLLILRDQINAAYPNRSKASDGTIGDPAHQAQGSASDHNPWLTLYGDPTGIVTALDVTHDPAHGCDINALTDELAASRDARIKYLIANGLILSGNDGPSPWVWRAYSGSDPHTNHFHLSVVADQRCDDTRPWGIAGGVPTPEGQTMALDQDPSGVYLIWRGDAIANLRDTFQGGPEVGKAVPLTALLKRIDTNARAAAEKATPVAMTDADRQAIIAGVVAQMPKPPTAAEVAEELARRIGNG